MLLTSTGVMQLIGLRKGDKKVINIENLVCHKNKRMRVHGPSQDVLLHPSREHATGIKKNLV